MGTDFSPVGRALAAPARSVFLDLLMDGSRRPAGELAAAARVGASTASEHLAVLVDAGLVTCEARGRQRFYALASPAVAEALEALGGLCPPTSVGSLRQSREARDLADARLCYDHLAGRLGVAVTDALVESDWLDGGLAVTADGAGRFAALGIDVDALRRGRRPLSRPCPDWTQRRDHLAGALGAALARHFLAEGWVKRRPPGSRRPPVSSGSRGARSARGGGVGREGGVGRGLLVTDGGRAALLSLWGLELERV